MRLSLAVLPLLLTPVASGQAPPFDGAPLCDGAVVLDQPLGVFAQAVTELPEMPPWCDGECVIDIGFIYADGAIAKTVTRSNGRVRSLGPQSLGELRVWLHHQADVATVAFRRAGLNARLRVVGIERDAALNGLEYDDPSPGAFRRVQERLPDLRRRYGADLVYAIIETNCNEKGSVCWPCGLARLRVRGAGADWASEHAAAGVIGASCVVAAEAVLAHEVGHNLGLHHHPTNGGGTPYLPFGQAWRVMLPWPSNPDWHDEYTTIMNVGGSTVGAWYSSMRPVRGRLMGDKEESDAARALLYTLPDAARYAPTVIGEAKNGPLDHGCSHTGDGVCLNNWRFEVSVNAWLEPWIDGSRAGHTGQPLELFGLGDSAAMFFFFTPDNPEVLMKILNGCGVNDYWWVFAAAATDLEYSIRIFDHTREPSGAWRTYNHLGGGVIVGRDGRGQRVYSTSAGFVNDTTAFRCRP